MFWSYGDVLFCLIGQGCLFGCNIDVDFDFQIGLGQGEFVGMGCFVGYVYDQDVQFLFVKFFYQIVCGVGDEVGFCFEVLGLLSDKGRFYFFDLFFYDNGLGWVMGYVYFYFLVCFELFQSFCIVFWKIVVVVCGESFDQGCCNFYMYDVFELIIVQFEFWSVGFVLGFDDKVLRIFVVWMC